VIDRTESQLLDRDRANRQQHIRQRKLERRPPQRAAQKTAARLRHSDVKFVP
jgi:hypothetical protein